MVSRTRPSDVPAPALDESISSIIFKKKKGIFQTSCDFLKNGYQALLVRCNVLVLNAVLCPLEGGSHTCARAGPGAGPSHLSKAAAWRVDNWPAGTPLVCRLDRLRIQLLQILPASDKPPCY